jgi:hypothetical protein
VFYWNLIDDYRSVIDNSRSVIDDSRVMLQLVTSFTIVIYDHHIFIAQATGLKVINPFTSFITLTLCVFLQL